MTTPTTKRAPTRGKVQWKQDCWSQNAVVGEMVLQVFANTRKTCWSAHVLAPVAGHNYLESVFTATKLRSERAAKAAALDLLALYERHTTTKRKAGKR